MRLIDKHIFWSITKIFLTTIFSFSLLYVLIDITSNLDEVLDRKVPAATLTIYYLSTIPIILVQYIGSIACLVACLFTYGRLNNDNEIITLRTSGLNFWQITKPAFCFACLIASVTFWVNEYYVPQATITTKKLRSEEMLRKEKSERKKKAKIKNLTFYGLKNRLYFIDTYSPNTSELSGITIIEFDEGQNIEKKITALRGVWTGIAWKFYNCQITTFEKAGVKRSALVKVYEEKLMDIKETPTDFLKQRMNVNATNINQLTDYIQRFSNSGANKALNNLKVDLHQKYAHPVSTVVVTLLGLPFVLIVRSRKRSTFTSFAIAIIIGFIYFILNAVCLAFGKGDLLPPFLAAWAAPLIITGVAITVIESNF